MKSSIQTHISSVPPIFRLLNKTGIAALVIFLSHRRMNSSIEIFLHFFQNRVFGGFSLKVSRGRLMRSFESMLDSGKHGWQKGISPLGLKLEGNPFPLFYDFVDIRNHSVLMMLISHFSHFSGNASFLKFL